jgi:hypothetical protein
MRVPLPLANQMIVVRMRSYPKPNPYVLFLHSQGTVTQTDPRRIDRPRRMHALEMEAGVGRVSAKLLKSLAGLFLYVRRELAESLPKTLRRCRSHRSERSRGLDVPWRYSSIAASANEASVSASAG